MPRMLVEDFYDKEEDRFTRACMVSFYPEFQVINTEIPVLNFLLDCSNSMKENKLIDLAKKLNLLMLRHLPKECLFNVTLFGTDYEELFPYPFKNSLENVLKANEFLINKTKNHRGATDLLNVLKQDIQLNELENKNYILISDGHFSRAEELLSQLNNKSNKMSRIFACSIGNSTNNNHLLKLVSRLTNSSFDWYDAKYQSKWLEKINDLMDKVKQPPAINDIKIEWQNFNQTQNSFDYCQAPSKITALFNGRRVFFNFKFVNVLIYILK